MAWKIYSIIVSIFTIISLGNIFEGVSLERLINIIAGVITAIGLFLYAFNIKSSNREIWVYFLFFYLFKTLNGLPYTLKKQFLLMNETKTTAAFVGSIIGIIINLAAITLDFIALWRYSEFQQWAERKSKKWR